MGLIISKFVNAGVEFDNAYAKVGDIKYDNNSKIAAFSVDIYVSKEKRNLIKKIQGLYVKVTPGTDLTAQCYNRINEMISQVNQRKSVVLQQIESEIDINKKYFLENKVVSIEKNEVLVFEGAVSDDIIQ